MGKPRHLSLFSVDNSESPDVQVCSGYLTRFRGQSGSEKEVTKEKGSCHKPFRTMAQAKAFIEDWRERYAEI
jgi:hypothetical protein